MRPSFRREKFTVLFAVKFAVIVWNSELTANCEMKQRGISGLPRERIARSPRSSVLTLLEFPNPNNLLNFRWRGCVSRWQVETFSPNRQETAAGTDSCVHGTVRIPDEVTVGSQADSSSCG